MIDVEKEDVVEFASELSTVVDEVWFRVLPFVNEVDLTSLGESEATAQLARLYLAAHMAKVMKTATSASPGAIASESVGGIRRSYAVIAASSSESLQTTKYGQAYESLLMTTVANGPMVV